MSKRAKKTLFGYPPGGSAREKSRTPSLIALLLPVAIGAGALGTGTEARAAVMVLVHVTAKVVVLDNPTVFNRLGAQNPNWITYALRRDVVFVNRVNPLDPDNGTPITQLVRPDLAGNVELRPDKRTRPLVVRSVAGACLTVNFQKAGRARFLQVTVEAMTRDPAVKDALEQHMPMIRNNLLMLFSSKSSDELRSRGGKEALQNEALASVQGVLMQETGNEGVEAVYFTSFVMQ